MFPSEDIYLRLPCDETQFIYQERSESPYFDNALVDRRLCEIAKPSKLGLMAFSVQISSIWSEILNNVCRSIQLSAEHYMSEFSSFHKSTMQRLSSWIQALPAQLTFKKPSAVVYVTKGNTGPFLSLHAIYHTAIIVLNRNVRTTLLPQSTLYGHMKEALDHARQLLEVVRTVEVTTLETENWEPTHSKYYRSSAIACSNPLVGYAILSAVDVLSAGGLLQSYDHTVALIENSLIFFERLNRFWASGQQETKAIRGRINRMLETIGSKDATQKRAWKCKVPLDVNLERNQDVFYDAEDQRGLGLLNQFGSKISEDDVLLVD